MSSLKPCAIDPALPASYPGNTYYCPDTNADGTANTFTQCCHNDRADADGNFHSCCQTSEEQSAERLGMMEQIGMYVGIATAVLVLLVFVYTYCRDDTFSCLKRVRARCSECRATCVDWICYCRCCSKKLRRIFRKKKKNPEVSYVREDTLVDPNATDNQFFW
ncbi:uncharacterized protein [Diadema setosum]|uniref:uncharacterized protein n=1 Tax=Diadema setosum TaxID=31175 RepID=UPI003B3B6030